MRSALLLVVLSSVAHAELPPLDVSVGYSADVFTARAYDLMATNDHLAMARVAVGSGVDLAVGAIDLELAFQTGSTAATAHGSGNASLWLRGLELGATWRYPSAGCSYAWRSCEYPPLFRYVNPYLHLGAGWDWATLTLFGEQRLTQTLSRISGRGLVGLQVPLRLSRSEGRVPTLVLDLGVGSVLRPEYAFTAMQPAPAKPTPVDAIAHASTSLGTLPMSGLTYRVLVSGRF